MSEQHDREADKAIVHYPVPTSADMRTHPVDIYQPWCKQCMLCVEFCPKEVFEALATGKVVAARPEDCIQCNICTQHCPDFAILLEPKPKKPKAQAATARATASGKAGSS